MSEEQGKKRETYNISPEQFVAIWQSAKTAQDAANAMSQIAGKPIPKEIVLSRASTYRKRGIKLKNMPRGRRKKLDVDTLNNIAGTKKAEKKHDYPFQE